MGSCCRYSKLILHVNTLTNVRKEDALIIENEYLNFKLEDSLVHTTEEIVNVIKESQEKNPGVGGHSNSGSSNQKVLDLDFSNEGILFIKVAKTKTTFSSSIAKSLGLISKANNPNNFIKGA